MKNFYIKKTQQNPNKVGDFVIAYADSDDMRLDEYSLILVLGADQLRSGLTNYTLFGVRSGTIMHITRPTGFSESIYLVNVRDIIPYDMIRHHISDCQNEQGDTFK